MQASVCISVSVHVLVFCCQCSHLFVDSCHLSSSNALALSTVIVRHRYLGTSSRVPAKSCAEIKSVRREVVTGVYWTLNASGLVQLEFCQY